MNNEINLIQLLLQSASWLCTKEISVELGISARTVRTLVKQINLKKTYILSSYQGYMLDKQNVDELLSSLNNNESECLGYSDEINTRQDYIIKQFLLTNNELNYYDLIDSLYISESTLNSDLTNLRKRLECYDMLLVRKKDKLQLIGTESKIRRLMSDTIYNEIKDGLLDSSILQHVFPDYDVIAIKNQLRIDLKSHGLSIDDFGITDLLLHLCIMLDRISCNQISSISDSSSDIKEIPNYEVTSQILNHLSNEVNIQIPNSEISAIAPLISINTRQLLDKNITLKDLSLLVDSHIIDFVEDITRQVMQNFSVDLNKDNFIVRFSLHLNQILKYHAKSSRNPLLKNIKDSYPLVFEISVYIANIIHNRYPALYLDDHDISYIALHVGMSINKDTENHIRVAILAPEYWILRDNLVDSIRDSFFNTAVITGVYDDETNVDFEKFDLLITTQKPLHKTPVEFALITPFFNAEDRTIVQSKIDSLLDRKHTKEALKFNDLFNEKCFIIYDNCPISKNVIIHDLCANMHSQGYCERDFENEVINRESMSSTAYSNIAVPHSLVLNGKKTGIGVALLKNPINWNGNRVNVVLLLVVTPENKGQFKNLFQDVVKIFTSSFWNDSFEHIFSYKDFITLVNKQRTN